MSGYTLTLSNGGVTISSSDPEYTVTGNSSVSISKGEYTKTVGTVEENFTGTYVIRGNSSFAANMSSIGVNATVKQVSGSVVPVGEDIFTSLYQLSPQGGTPFPVDESAYGLCEQPYRYSVCGSICAFGR